MITAIYRNTGLSRRPRSIHTPPTCAGTFQLDGVPEEHVRGLRRGYYACVSFIDEQLGRLLSALVEADLAGTTNLVYTSDHGEMLGKFGLWWKCNLLEDAAQDPCIAAGPDFDSGMRVTTPVDLHDVQPACSH